MKALAVLALLMVAVSAENYAVLVAGSNEFYNYRHQADVCHGYQLLLSKGMKASNIIVMSYDDVASSSQNPFPNTLYNKPSTGPGIDVNKGCIIDYKGADVTPENYEAILTGGSPSGGNGRVLESTSSDNVFLAFYDHGGAGLIAFPSEYLYADKLLSTFDQMHSNGKYAKLTYYMEACESGSMFQKLTTPNVYAVSAANPTQSSWGTYCSPDDKVDGKEIGSCLGDLFSVNWMENSDATDLTKETLQAQWKLVASETASKSEVMQWGDKSFTTEPAADFIGGASSSKFLRSARRLEQSNKSSANVESRNIKLHYLTNKFNKLPSEENYNELQMEMSLIKYFQEKVDAIKSTVVFNGEQSETTNFECYRSVVNKFEAECGKVNDNGLRHFRVFYEMCAQNIDMESTFATIENTCA